MVQRFGLEVQLAVDVGEFALLASQLDRQCQHPGAALQEVGLLLGLFSPLRQVEDQHPEQMPGCQDGDVVVAVRLHAVVPQFMPFVDAGGMNGLPGRGCQSAEALTETDLGAHRCQRAEVAAGGQLQILPSPLVPGDEKHATLRQQGKPIDCQQRIDTPAEHFFHWDRQSRNPQQLAQRKIVFRVRVPGRR
ncbi:MAG: hypothetical protein U0R66_04765 [Mycobacterium sp.]